MRHFFIYSFLVTTFFNSFDLKADNISIEKDSIELSYTANEIVIQSFKSNDNLSQLPVSATLLSEQIIRERNVSNIKEISGFIPNLYIPDYGSKMTSPAYIRGIGSRINAPSIGLYVDGVPYFDRSSFDINIEDVDRVEVLRGPQGTLYGRNTMGGLINIYTKSPFKYKETNLGLSAGNYNTYHANASHYGNIDNVFGYSLSGSYLKTGGYITNDFNGKRANPMDALSGRIRLSWRATSNLFFHLTSAYEYSDQDGYAYAPYDDETNKIGVVDYNAHSFYRRNMSTTGLNAQYNNGQIRFDSQSSFQYFDGHQGIDQDFTREDNFYVDFYQLQRMYSQEFNVRSVNSRKYDWLFGAMGFYQEYGTKNDVNLIKQKVHTYQNVNTPSTGFALFHQSVFKDVLFRGLSATIGLRYDWEEIKAHAVLSNKAGEAAVAETKNERYKDTYSQLSPKFALQYTFTNNEMVYASVTKGYKSGGFNSTSQRDESLTFKPEYSWSYEIGTKASCFDNLVYTDISLFYIHWDDQQVSQNQADGRGYILRNAGKSVSKGLEVAMHLNPLENLSFSLSYGYTHAKFKDYVYSAEETNKIDYSGKYLPMVPQNTFAAGASYSIAMNKGSFLEKIIFNAQYTGQGKLYWKEDNQAVQPFYGTLNAKTSFVMKNISFDVWAKNITNQQYVSYYFTTTTDSYAQQGRPFTCGVNLNVKF